MRARATKLSAIGFNKSRDVLPSLDLAFALDKTLTARKGPTPTFTRGSGNNGGVNYVGPIRIIVNGDLNKLLSQNPSVINQRFFWQSALVGDVEYTAQYMGDRWRLRIRVVGDEAQEIDYFAAIGSEWLPYLADWSESGITVVAGSTMGIVRAADNEPRFDHDPVTGICRGLLIEELRGNLFQRSEEFDNAYWAKFQLQPFGSGSIANTTETTAPDGSNNSDKLVENTANDRHQINDNGITVAAGTAYTFSIFVKKPAGSAVSHIMIAYGGVAGSGLPSTSLNLTTLEIGNTLGGPNLNSSAIQYSNGWIHLRCTITTTTAGQLTSNFQFSRNGLFANRVYTGDGTSGVYLWGAQLEAGSFPTSYIRTTTTALTRSADVCSITGANFTSFYNQSEGSFACNYSIFAGFTGNRYAASIEDVTGGTQNGFTFRNTNNATSFINGAGYSSVIGSITTGSSKHILAYTGLSEFVYCKNSVVGTTTGSGTRDPSLPIRMSIGGLEGSFQLCGHIARIQYFRKRLPNAKLQSLTAP